MKLTAKSSSSEELPSQQWESLVVFLQTEKPSDLVRKICVITLSLFGQGVFPIDNVEWWVVVAGCVGWPWCKWPIGSDGTGEAANTKQ